MTKSKDEVGRMKRVLFEMKASCLKSMLFILHPSYFILALTAVVLLASETAVLRTAHAQEAFPAPPADRTRIYIMDETGAAIALPFEEGATPLKTDVVAKSDKTSYIELKGGQGKWKIKEPIPRFYLFVPDEANVHPPFIVRMTDKGDARRVAAMSQKGFKGFAINSEEIVKPRYRVLARVDGMLYMEVRPREPLEPGVRYAIIGTDLQRIVSFEVVFLLK